MKNVNDYERVNNVYNIFKYIIKLNQYRFNCTHIDTVIEILIDFADLDISYIDINALRKRIIMYCDRIDTGIYY